MNLLNTKFPATITPEQFMTLVKKWINESEFISIDLSDYDFEKQDYTKEADNCKCIINNLEDAFIFQFILKDEKEIFDTTFVVRNNHISVTQNHEYLQYAANQFSPDLKIPTLLKMIFWEEYADDDNGLPTDNKVFIIRKNNIDTAVNMINNTEKYELPIVYVSPNKNGAYEPNYDILAQELIGQAHVLVENSPNINEMIGEKTEKKNPFNGAVTIYYPGDEKTTLLSNGKGFHFDIIKAVRRTQTRIQMPDEFNATKIRQTALLKKFKDGADAEFVELCETMLAEKDDTIQTHLATIKQLESEIEELKTTVANITAKADALQNSLNAKSEFTKDDKTVTLKTLKDEMYAGEFKDIIVKILQKEVNAMNGDPNTKGSRKYDVLKTIVMNNKPTETPDIITKELKNIFTDTKMTSAMKSQLEALGFTITKTNNGHYELRYHNYEEKAFIMPGTTSDNARGLKNLTSSITNTLFGF